MQCALTIESPIGRLTAVEENGGLILLHLPNETRLPAYESGMDSPLLRETERQLTEYFTGKRHVFSLPLRPSGTEFRKRVWEALCRIPYGETRSYRDIAILIGSPNACRAVGGANHVNPLPILIPCHRVVGASGGMVGYGGGLDVKEFLLGLEKTQIQTEKE